MIAPSRSRSRWLAMASLAIVLALTAACSGNGSTSQAAPSASGTPAASTAGNGVLAKVKESQVLRCASSNDPPVLYKNSSGNPDGLFYDLLTQMFEKQGLKDVRVEPEYMPFQSVIAALQSGRVDLVCDTMNMTPERKKQIDFTLPILNNTDIVVVPKGNPAKIHGYAEMKDKSCGTYEGTLWVPWCEELGKSTKVFQTQQDTIAGVAAHRVDGAFLDILSASYALRENPTLPVEAGQPLRTEGRQLPGQLRRNGHPQGQR